jgi:hypothetical protein
MANICNNIMHVYFKDNKEDNAKTFLKEFADEFNYKLIFPDVDEEGNFYEHFDGILEINFDSKWSTPTNKLEEYSLKYSCNFLGVSYEWGNGYVNCFDIDNSDFINFEEIEADRQINLQKDEQNHG